MSINLKDHIRSVPDFPKDGILFYDIATLLADGLAWRETVTQMCVEVEKQNPDVLVGIEARGFLIGASVAAHLGKPFVMVRKPGKLPGATQSYTYTLEYGDDTIVMQDDMIQKDQKVMILDDLLATGGTTEAAIHLVRQMGGIVTGAAFIIELPFLNGRAKLDVPVAALISYDS